jgi:hypothetical protein
LAGSIFSSTGLEKADPETEILCSDILTIMEAIEFQFLRGRSLGCTEMIRFISIFLEHQQKIRRLSEFAESTTEDQRNGIAKITVYLGSFKISGTLEVSKILELQRNLCYTL